MKIIKRNGAPVEFDGERINRAIAMALAATDEVPSSLISLKAKSLGAAVEVKLYECFASKNKDPGVEDVQDMVESELMTARLPKTAKAYILYRKTHENVRDIKAGAIDCKKQIDGFIGPEKDWRVKENATVTCTLGGLILSNSGAITANYWLNEVYDQEIADAHRNCDIHIHDLSMLAPYCAGWSLKQLIEEGLGGVPGRVSSAPAQHLSTLCNQMVNFLGILQNEWAGRI